jgi:hypothetical protein
MKILAIDPGNVQSAFVRWDTDKDEFAKFCTQPHLGLEDNKSLYEIFPMLSIEIEQVCCEMVQSYGLGVGRTIFETCVFVGEIKSISRMCGIPFKMYGRPTIKGQVGGKNDAEIRASLRLRHGEAKKGEKLEGVKKDIWAALALATALTENPNLKEW